MSVKSFYNLDVDQEAIKNNGILLCICQRILHGLKYKRKKLKVSKKPTYDIKMKWSFSFLVYTLLSVNFFHVHLGDEIFDAVLSEEMHAEHLAQYHTQNRVSYLVLTAFHFYGRSRSSWGH